MAVGAGIVRVCAVPAAEREVEGECLVVGQANGVGIDDDHEVVGIVDEPANRAAAAILVVGDLLAGAEAVPWHHDGVVVEIHDLELRAVELEGDRLRDEAMGGAGTEIGEIQREAGQRVGQRGSELEVVVVDVDREVSRPVYEANDVVTAAVLIDDFEAGVEVMSDHRHGVGGNVDGGVVGTVELHRVGHRVEELRGAPVGVLDAQIIVTTTE